MDRVTTWLVDETNARIGYTQSDEISLVWHTTEFKSQIFFDGKQQKMCSILAAMCSVKFNELIKEYLPDKADVAPVFDCRVWNVPNLEEATNYLIWRQADATNNSVQMAARAVYSHKACMDKGVKELQEMLHQKGINWNDYPAKFKRGTLIRRMKVCKKFTTEELDSLPPKHNAHKNPEVEFERTQTECLEIPQLTKIDNRVEVLFGG
jgi:tRNA(His) 5'-end guanylyltransferase